MKKLPKRKILILGAGIGGLYCAINLSKKGFDVTVIEKRQKDELGYPWYDSVDDKTFDSVKMTVPQDIIVNKQVLYFAGPAGMGNIKQPERVKKNFDVNRKGLIEFMTGEAEKVCKVLYGKEFSKLIIEDGFVKGASNGEEELRADLTIDSSGLFSPFRKQTPDDFLMNEEVEDEEFFAAYRGFLRKTDNKELSARVYLQPDGLGLIWAKDEPGGNADVLIGALGSLSDDDIKKGKDYIMRFYNNVVDEETLHVQDYIPVRHPIGVLAGNGYALVGNSAFMTRPMCGSGIELTLRAANMLCNCVRSVKDKEFSAANLWQYSVRYVKELGADMYAQYLMRVMAQKIPYEDLDWIFSSGLLNEGLIALTTMDVKNLGTFSISSLVSSIKLALTRKDLVKKAGEIIMASVKAKRYAYYIPEDYNLERIREWKKTIDETVKYK